MSVPLNTILSWFQTGDFPTEQQFAQSWSSFRHKDEKIAFSDVLNLESTLQNKVDKSLFETNITNTAKIDASNLNSGNIQAWKTILNVPIVPNNLATIDSGTLVGNVWDRFQSDSRYLSADWEETDTFIENPVLAGSELAIYYNDEKHVRQRGIVDLTPFKNDVLASSNTGYKGYIKKSDSMPTVIGLYRLLESGTYINLTPAVDEFGNSTTIIFEDGKLNDVYYNGTNWQKSDSDLIDLSNTFIPSDTTKAQPAKNIADFVTLKTQSIYKITDFKQGVYFPSTTGLTVSVGNSLQFGYDNASPDVASIKIPIVKNEKALIYTNQGAFSPCFITDYNNVVVEVFGTSPGHYLDVPLEITAGFDGYLYVNAHEFTDSERSKIKIVKGDAYRILQNLPDPEDDSFLAVLKVVKKNGTVGTDCDFTDIRDALNAITDNSAKKRYILYVMDGDYDYSDNGDVIGVRLKNWVTLRGQSYKTRIIKRDSVFDWAKATIDKEAGDMDYIAIEGFFTIISNNCKCPIHIDSGVVKYGLFQNLNLINEQPLGNSGDNPRDGEANCFALGFRGSDHIVLKNITANGKLWGHNETDKNSNGIFEFINCDCRTIQIGELTSQGNDTVIVKGCNSDEFQLLWFSEPDFVSSEPYRNSYNFVFEGNNIKNAVIRDHKMVNDIPVQDALEVFYKGKFPFRIAGIHKEFYGANIVKGSNVSKVNNSTVKTWEVGETVFGKALENTDENGRLLIHLID